MKNFFNWNEWVAKFREWRTGTRFQLRFPPGLKKLPRSSFEFFKNLKLSRLNRERLAEFRANWRTHLANLPSQIANLPRRIPKEMQIQANTLRYINLASIAVAAYFAANLAATVLAPFFPDQAPSAKALKIKMREPLLAYDSITSRNLFNYKGLIPEDGAGADPGGTPVKTSLPLELMGIIIVRDNLKSVASVSDRNRNDVIAVKVNEQISPDAVVQIIEENRVIFLNRATNRREYIELPEDLKRLKTRPAASGAKTGVTKLDDSHMVVDRAEVDKALADLSNVVTQARCVPHLEGGRPAGFRCFQVVPGSIFEKIGIQNGDIVCGINGQELNDITQALGLFEQLKTSNSIELCLKRNRQTLNVRYDIQ